MARKTPPKKRTKGAPKKQVKGKSSPKSPVKGKGLTRARSPVRRKTEPKASGCGCPFSIL